MKISESLDSIRKCDIVIPEFQREYVWNLDQAKELMISLVNGYPVGGLLLWKTDNPPELKGIEKLPEKVGTVQVLLDGQQRLTTLNMLLTGDIPTYYSADEILNDPRDLYVNLDSLEFQYYQRSRMAGDPRWQRVVDCFDTGREPNALAIAEQIASDAEPLIDIAKRLLSNMQKLKNVKDVDIPTQSVPYTASLTQAIRIFDRINSQGTKLTDAELALTHIVAKWAEARRVMKAKILELEDRYFYFDLAFMTRALTIVVTGRALFEVIHDQPRENLISGWEKLCKILDYLVTLLPLRAFINSTLDLNTTNALIPLVAFLSRNNAKFPNDDSIKHAINWLNAALIWTRYTSQTDQRLEADASLIAREKAPWEALRAQIIDQRGRIRIEPSDFAGRGVQNPLYRASFMLAKAHGAVDWFNGLPLSQPHGDSFVLHSHHIFPQALLYRSGYNQDDYTHKQVVNEIANRAFLTADSNLLSSATPPDEYLPEVERNFPGALDRQFIPLDPLLWKVDRYADFLSARRILIAKKLNEYLEALISKPEPMHHRPITDLIQLGESYTLEFKGSWQWDLNLKQTSRIMRTMCLKSIGAFLNCEGGTLVIGVEDGGAILGLDPDLKLANHSLDILQQQIATAITDTMGVNAPHYARIRFENVSGKKVCVVDMDRSPEPVFTKTEKGQEFFCRIGNMTRSLNPEETHDYINQHWT